jgi:GntR family transcriptional regulator
MKSTDLQSTTETDSRRPKYQRIRDHLYSEIRAGRLAPGQSLPTEARLVESLGFSRHTVRQALAELENDGVIERVQSTPLEAGS